MGTIIKIKTTVETRRFNHIIECFDILYGMRLDKLTLSEIQAVMDKTGSGDELRRLCQQLGLK